MSMLYFAQSFPKVNTFQKFLMKNISALSVTMILLGCWSCFSSFSCSVICLQILVHYFKLVFQQLLFCMCIAEYFSNNRILMMTWYSMPLVLSGILITQPIVCLLIIFFFTLYSLKGCRGNNLQWLPTRRICSSENLCLYKPI